MRCISYDIVVEYDDLFNNKCRGRYSFFADNEEDARRIAYECFLMEVGSSDTVQIHIRPTPLSEVERNYVNDVLSSYLSPIRSSLSGKVYMDFIKLFQSMSGYGLKLSPDTNSFWFEMNNITCKIAYESGLCYVDTKEIIVSDRTSNRKYIIRNNLQDYYIGV